MYKYHHVAKTVEPKKARLQAAQDTLATAQAALKVKQDELQVVVDKVNALKQQLSDAEKLKKELQDNADISQKRLGRAGKLTSALGD